MRKGVLSPFRDFLPIFGFCLILFLFGPGQIFFTNSAEFFILYEDLLRYGLLLAAAASCFLFLLSLPVKRKPSVHQLVITAFVALTLLLWIQGQFLVWNYGLFDGRPVVWRDHLIQGLIDGTIWLVVLSLALLLTKKLYPHLNQIAGGLIFLQLISVAFWLPRLPEPPSFKEYTIDETNKYAFSKNKNVIILVLDAFQADFFQELINENPSLKNDFNGFTYFRNSLAGHPFTETSTMNILTGHFYDGVESFEKHNRNVYAKSMPALLKARGFEVDLFPSIGRAVYYAPEIASNFKPGRPHERIRSDLSLLFQASLFRQVFTALKMPIYEKKILVQPSRSSPLKVNRKIATDSQSRYHFSRRALESSNTLRFIVEMSTFAKASTRANVFKYYHLDLPHWPLRITDRFEYKRMDATRQSYKSQALAALKISVYFLQELKRLGAYDNSMIFIVGDHGAGAQGQVFMPAAGFPLPDHEPVISARLQINALPLMLIKRFHSIGSLRASNAPASLADITSTVFDEFGIPAAGGGKSVFGIREDEDRVRKYIGYHAYDRSEDRYVKMEEWFVNGYSWLQNSWRRSPRIVKPGGRIVNAARPFQTGTTIQFGDKGSGSFFQTSGWRTLPAGSSWTLGKTAELMLPFKRTDFDVTLTVHLMPRIPNPTGHQPVVLYLNNEKLEDWNVSIEGDYRALIPKQQLSGEAQKLLFKLPLEGPGFGIKSLRIEKTFQCKPGKRLRFGKNKTCSQYLTSGWTLHDKTVRTSATAATLTIPLSEASSDLMVRMKLKPFSDDNQLAAQRVEVHLNGEPAAIWTVGESGEYSLKLSENLKSIRILKLQFDLPHGSSNSGIILQSLIIELE